MNKAAQAYFQTKVNTTDQGQLLLLLYDGALRFLQQAREKMLAKDYAGKGILISKVIDILNELTNTLNLEKGGTLAENLNNLYFLCTTRLLQANLKMNVEQLDNVVSILSGLRSAYAEIIETPEARRASAQISARLNVDASVNQRAAVQIQNTTAPTGLGRMQARNAYGVQNAMTNVPPAMQASRSAVGTAPSAVPTSATPQAPATPVAQEIAQQVLQQTTQLQQTQQAPEALQNNASQSDKAAAIPFAASPTMAPVQPASVAPKASEAPVAEGTAKPTPKAPANAPKQGFGVSGFAYTKAFGK